MVIVMDALLGNAASVPARTAPLLTRRKSLVDRGGPGGETQQPLPTLNEAPVGGWSRSGSILGRCGPAWHLRNGPGRPRTRHVSRHL